MSGLHDTTIAAPSPTRIAPLTHFVRSDTNSRIAMAACGRFVNPTREHALDPSCPACRKAIEDYEAITF